MEAESDIQAEAGFSPKLTKGSSSTKASINMYWLSMQTQQQQPKHRK